MYTIYGILRNAQGKMKNFDNKIRLKGDEELTAAIELLFKGYHIMDNYSAIIQEYGSAEAAPQKVKL